MHHFAASKHHGKLHLGALLQEFPGLFHLYQPIMLVGDGSREPVAQAARALYRPGRRFEPDTELRAQYAEAFTRYRALYEALYGGKRTDA